MSMMFKCKQITNSAFINKVSDSTGILIDSIRGRKNVVFVSRTRSFMQLRISKKSQQTRLCVQNESVIKLLGCAHVSCFALLFILASFVFEMVSKRWMNGGFMCSQKAMLMGSLFFGLQTIPLSVIHGNFSLC
jgi:hypothetical protein